MAGGGRVSEGGVEGGSRPRSSVYGIQCKSKTKKPATESETPHLCQPTPTTLGPAGTTNSHRFLPFFSDKQPFAPFRHVVNAVHAAQVPRPRAQGVGRATSLRSCPPQRPTDPRPGQPTNKQTNSERGQATHHAHWAVNTTHTSTRCEVIPQ